MEIQRLTIAELADWIESDTYAQLPIVPISRLRALSYLHNPRTSPADIICYLAWKGKELIGFRTLLVDRFYNETSFQKFAWFSGVWVAPTHRREGIATRLLEVAWRDWEGKLMVTHTSPSARELCLNSGLFQLYYTKPGRRYYLRFALHRLLAPRHSLFRQLSGFIKGGDALLNAFHDRKLLLLQFRISVGEIPFKSLAQLDGEWNAFVEKHLPGSLTQRGVAELQWMEEFPWVKAVENLSFSQQHYPFTDFTQDYQLLKLGIYNSDQNPQAFMVLLRVGGHLTIPYYFGEDRNLADSEIKDYIQTLILYYLVQWKCDMLTVYHPPLVHILDKVKGVFLYKKRFEETYLASSSLFSALPQPQALTWQDGEGDVGFTG